MKVDERWLGKAEIKPKKATAGEFGTWELTYTVGEYGIDDGGGIIIARRDVCDSQIPQFTDPTKPGYTTVKTTGRAKLLIKYVEKFFIRPWRSCLVIEVRDGALKKGDKIIVVFGDKSGGSPGFRMQTFREKEHVFKVLVDPFGTGRYVEVKRSPSITIIGGEAERLEIVAPSIVSINERFSVILRALDRWGNPAQLYTDVIRISCDDSGARMPKILKISEKDEGVKLLDGIYLSRAGIHYIFAKTESGLKAMSNPILCVDNEPNIRLFWGDLHGQTAITIGTGTVEEYLTYARDVAGLDFTSWQGNDFQIEKKDWWDDVCVQVRRFNEPGRFVVFLGYEWSGNTPAGGDHNIYFLGDDQQIYRSSHWLVKDKSDVETDRYPITELWRTFQGRKDVMAVPHIGGRPANLDFFNPELIKVIEIYSQHGTFEWFAEEALKRNLKVGFIAGSDDHTGRPGLTGPTQRVSCGASFNLKGGLTGVFSDKLTRDSIWKAIWSRHCYATTGDRIILFFNSDEHLMGDEYKTNKPPKLWIKVIGTDGIQEIEIRKGPSVIYNYLVGDIPKNGRGFIKIEWSGVRTKYRNRETIWDGELTVDNGRIINAFPFAFDLPDDGLKEVSSNHLKWKSTSSGDPDGVVLELEFSRDTLIRFRSKQGSFKFKPAEVMNKRKPKIVNFGYLNKRVRIVPLGDSRRIKVVELTYKDEDITPGMNSYWVKVIQWNGEIAWSSPIFINYAES